MSVFSTYSFTVAGKQLKRKEAGKYQFIQYTCTVEHEPAIKRMPPFMDLQTMLGSE